MSPSASLDRDLLAAGAWLPWGGGAMRAIHALAAGVPGAAFIRHSAREPIVDLVHADEAKLTPEGELGARAWGRALPRGRRVRLVHSPVGRCGMTAVRIAEGVVAAGGAATVEGADAGLLIPYARDEAGIVRGCAQLGMEGFIRSWFDGDIPDSVVVPRPEAAASQLAVAVAALEQAEPDALIVLVSHDWNVLLLRETYLGVRHEEAGWAGFLDGPVVTLEAGGAARLAWGRRTGAAPGTD